VSPLIWDKKCGVVKRSVV